MAPSLASEGVAAGLGTRDRRYPLGIVSLVMRFVLLGLFIVVSACSSASNADSTEPSGGDSVAVAGSLVCWSSPQDGSAGAVVFQEVTADLGLVDPLTGIRGHAAAVGDVNGDDHPDLLVGTFADKDVEDYVFRGATGPKPDQLLLTSPDWVASEGWSTELQRTSGAIFADLDADADDDLVIVRNAGVRGDDVAVSRVFENVDGVLEPRSEILPTSFRGRTPTVADFDRDGLLDLYISEDRYGDFGGVLLKNEGNWVFVDRTAGSGLEGVPSLAARAADLNDDGQADLVLSTHVFLSSGDFTFEDVTPDGYVASPFTEEDDPAGTAVGDLNNDGLPDVVIGKHFRSTVEDGNLVPVSVFMNRSEGQDFRLERLDGGVEPLPTLAPHVHVADMNNDGLADIVTSSSVDGGAFPLVYVNEGGDNPTFTVAGASGELQYWVGAPTLDFDRDGRLDILAVEWDPALPTHLFENNSSSGHWLQVSVGLPGRGVGAVVTVESPDGVLVGRQEIGVATGYSSGHQPMAHFGLGALESVAVTLETTDGSTHDLGVVSADAHIRWPEGCG